MSTTIQLPGDHTATLRDPQKLRERHKRLIQTAMLPLAPIFARIPSDLLEKAATGDKSARSAGEALMLGAIRTRQEAVAMREMRDAVVVALLENWSLPQLLPDMETIQDLDPEIYEALADGTDGLVSGVMQAAQGVNFEVKPPGEEYSGSPFVNSGNSGTSAKAKVNGVRPARRSSRATASSATGKSTKG